MDRPALSRSPPQLTRPPPRSGGCSLTADATAQCTARTRTRPPTTTTCTRQQAQQGRGVAGWVGRGRHGPPARCAALPHSHRGVCPHWTPHAEKTCRDTHTTPTVPLPMARGPKVGTEEHAQALTPASPFSAIPPSITGNFVFLPPRTASLPLRNQASHRDENQDTHQATRPTTRQVSHGPLHRR
jgi:hypothetical protein